MEHLGLHLRGRNIHTLFAGKRRGYLQPWRNGHIPHHPDNHRVLVHVAADRARPVEEFACERLVDDGYPLRIRPICVGKRATHQNWNLQCAELVRCYIHLTRHIICLASLPSAIFNPVFRARSYGKLPSPPRVA
jgi:hypothetical protein